MKNSRPKSTNRRFNLSQYNFLKLTLIVLLLAIPAIVSAQCTLIITNPPAVCSPATVDITHAAITAGSDAGLSFSYWTNAGATVALANPGAVAASGTYYIKAVNVSGCNNIKPVTVIVNPAVSPTFAPIGPFCQNSPAPALPLISANGISGAWNPSVISTVTIGTVTYTFTPAAGQCTIPVSMAVTVNPVVTPTFNAIPPLCSGAVAPVLPATSLNGITGTWSPATISTAWAGNLTLTFNPAAGQCATITILTVTIKNIVVPVFAALGPFCPGSIPSALPAISINGVAGTWSPAVISTSVSGVSTYIFTPGTGECSIGCTMNVTVTDLVVPVFPAMGPYCVGTTPATLPTTSANGITGTWSPAVISTANAGTTAYTFTPAPGPCRTLTTITVTVATSVVPATITGPAIRCQGAGTEIYRATSVNSTGISFYLDAASSAGGNSINPSTGVVTFVASWTGPSVISAIAEGCNGPAISSFSVTTLPVPSATISYGGSPYCMSIATKQPVTLTGTTGGVFSATPPGLVIDPATGEITPATSEAGRYTVSYKVGSDIGCSEVIATGSVSIIPCNVQQITVTASHGQSKIFGDPDPLFSYYYTPALDAGDRFTGYLSREPGENTGTYPITLGNLSAGPNYQITFISANFEIIASSADATLADLQVDGTTITGFSPSIYTYDLIFLPGTIIIPVITATTKNPKAAKTITPAAAIPGSTKILVTSEDGSRQITYEVKMTLQTTGINQVSVQNNFMVYPNPNDGTFTFEHQSNGTGPVRLSVLDITGRVLKDQIYSTVSKITEVIQIPDRSGGIYLIRLINDSGVSYRKIIVK